MEPKEEERFVPRKAKEVIEKVVAEKTKSMKEYDATQAKQISMELVKDIKEGVKQLEIPRYKIVVQAVVGQVQGQGSFIASRCMWDIKTDNYASYSFKAPTYFVTVMVFGLYLE